MRCDVRKMIRRIEAAGLIVEPPRGKGHFRVLRPNGTLVCTMSTTPSDVRNDKNLITRIRRNTGITV